MRHSLISQSIPARFASILLCLSALSSDSIAGVLFESPSWQVHSIDFARPTIQAAGVGAAHSGMRALPPWAIIASALGLNLRIHGDFIQPAYSLSGANPLYRNIESGFACSGLIRWRQAARLRYAEHEQ